MCLLRPSGHCVACGGDAQSWLMVRIVLQCHCRPRCGLVIAAQEEMCMRGPASHYYQRRIKWTQAHGTREALNRQFWLAEPDFGPTAERPCLRQIGIEHKRAID